MSNKKDLEENVIYWSEANGFIPHSGNPAPVLPHGQGQRDANQAVRPLPKPKAFPLVPSGRLRRSPRASAEPFSPRLSVQTPSS